MCGLHVADGHPSDSRIDVVAQGLLDLIEVSRCPVGLSVRHPSISYDFDRQGVALLPCFTLLRRLPYCRHLSALFIGSDSTFVQWIEPVVQTSLQPITLGACFFEAHLITPPQHDSVELAIPAISKLIG